ncbi:hypothetical protein ABMA58_14230 [Oceanospirillum sp. HFRX-1_2]
MFSKIKWIFIFSITSSILLVLLYAFKWSIVEIITVFLMMPLYGFVWLFFIVCMVFSLTSLFNFKSVGLTCFAPLGIHVVALVLVAYVPFTMLWLKADYMINKEQREQVVAKVLNGELQPHVNYNASLINLSDGYPGLSRGGNDIVIESHEGLTYVLFFTFRGVLDNYSGYLYVPKGGSPEMYSDLNESEFTQIKHIESNWYLISHR